jgi:hypothetical protein
MRVLAAVVDWDAADVQTRAQGATASTSRTGLASQLPWLPAVDCGRFDAGVSRRSPLLLRSRDLSRATVEPTATVFRASDTPLAVAAGRRALRGPTAKTHRRPQRSPRMGRLRSANPLIQKGPNATNATNAKMQGDSFCGPSERLCPSPRGFPQRQLASRTGALRPSSATTAKDRAGVVHGFQAILSPRRLCGGERPLSSLTKALPWSP